MNAPRMVSLGLPEERFPVGTHLCYIYNDELERRQVIARFIDSGLQSGEKVGYLVHDTTPEAFRRYLAEEGVSLPPPEDETRFWLRLAPQVYTPDGAFDPDRMLNNLASLYRQGEVEGFAASRVSGEMAWSLAHMPGADRLIEYEARINLLVVESPITAICQYDARRFDGATLFDVLSVHPMMIVQGQIVHNPYYVPPERFLARTRSAPGHP